MAVTYPDIDAYIAACPEEVRPLLDQVRRTIHEAVPGLGETISYQIPAMTLDGRSVVQFAAWRGHLSLYPLPAGDDAFERAVAPYRSGKSTLKFPLAAAIPFDLIARAARLLADQRGGSPGPQGH